MKWYAKYSLNSRNFSLQHLHVLEPLSCSTAKYLIIANPVHKGCTANSFLFWVSAWPAAVRTVSTSLFCSEQMLLGSRWVEEQAGFPFQILQSLRFSVPQSRIYATNQCMANMRGAAETHCELRRVRWTSHPHSINETGKEEGGGDRDDLSTASQTDSSDLLVGDAHYPLLLDSKLIKDFHKMQWQKGYKLLSQYSEQH